jgi:glycosyltransferase involved in cell wall biosynthesis
MNVLLMGPDYRCKGGIASVLKNYLDYPNKNNIKFRFISVRGDQAQLIKLIQSITAIFKMIWIIISCQIDILHAHPSEYSGFYRYIPYLFIGKLFKLKVVFHIHGCMFDVFYESQSKIAKKIIKNALNRCDTIICLSNSWEEVFKKLGVQRLEIIKNTVYQPDKNPYDAESLNLTFMGFIEKRKGIYDLIESLANIKDKGDILLNICGSGEDSYLDSQIDKHNVKNKTIKHGWIDAETKDRILRKTSVFILPSYHEGLPMVLLEAMAYGIPVISTTVGGIPELVNNGIDGLLLEPGDIKGLSDAIVTLFEDKELRTRMSQSVYYKIKQEYTMQVTFEKLHKIYTNILSK